jgi:hypothetical protein
MDAILLPGQLWRESEFVYDPASKRWLTGTCGPNASAMAESWAEQRYISTLDVYHRMRAAGRCDANGAATLASLADDVRAAGYTVEVLPYREPMPEADWRGFFAQHVGRQAVVFETANGQALVDSISGKGENARNLRYHFVLIVGWHPGGHSPRMNRDLPPGWWCSDGDNFAQGNVLQFYPDAVLAAARPCAAMAVYARVRMPAPDGSGATEAGVPQGWRDDGKTLTAPNGHRVVLGFRAHVLAAKDWPPDDVPLEEERHVEHIEWQHPALGGGSRQLFLRTALCWSPAQGVREIPLGAELLAVETELATMEKQLAAANEHAAALQRQLTALLQQAQQLQHAEDPAVAAIKALAVALSADVPAQPAA